MTWKSLNHFFPYARDGIVKEECNKSKISGKISQMKSVQFIFPINFKHDVWKEITIFSVYFSLPYFKIKACLTHVFTFLFGFITTVKKYSDSFQNIIKESRSWEPEVF